ncbi:MAG: hypothetical protein R6U40_02900 [Desulfobacterales bacterium]
MRKKLLLPVLAIVFIINVAGCGKSESPGISFNEKITGELEGEDAVEYTFEGKEGQKIYLEQEDSDGELYFKLEGPDGFEVFKERGRGGGYEAVKEKATLKSDGTYTLSLNGKDADKGEFEFVLWDVEPAVIEGGTVEFNKLIKGQTEFPGQNVEYTFEAEEGQNIYLEQEDSDGKLYFKLEGPDGFKVFKKRGRGGGLETV